MQLKLTTTNEHYARIERERLPGESFMHCLSRKAIEDAQLVVANGAEGAALLGYSNSQGYNMAVQRMREFVVDARIGRLDAHKRGGGAEAHQRAALTRMSKSPLMHVNQEAAS